MRSVQEIQSAFMRMDVNGDGSLTKREMLAADEFTPEEVEHQHGINTIPNIFISSILICQPLYVQIMKVEKSLLHPKHTVCSNQAE